jgi:hypothetical protein
LKPLRRKKVLGIAIGERSLLAAEVLAGATPQVTHLAELVFSEGISPASPQELGKALGEFLREHGFTARAAVVGLPARWLVVRQKEVPPADPSTVKEMLRLAAEGEFPSDLKDLVFDFSGEIRGGETKSVLLVATPQKYVDGAVAMCQEARLGAASVTSSAVALGEATSRSVSPDALVLAVGPSGSEMTVQTGVVASSLRHLRAPIPQPPFVSELRRALMTVMGGKTGRELILWDGAGLDAPSLSENLGVKVRSSDLPALGVSTIATSSNGEGRKYAAAVALALSGMGLGEVSVDFLHSRLAPPRQRRVPQWAVLAAIAALAAIVGGIWAYTDLQSKQTEVASMQAKLDGMKAELTTAEVFVSKVSFAQAWHGGDPRYLACVRDLTSAVPEDFQTYATSLVLHEVVHPPLTGQPTPAAVAALAKQNETHTLAGQFYGKTSDQQRVETLLERMKKIPTFADVKLGGSNSGRAGEVSFSITFNYVPPKSGQ